MDARAAWRLDHGGIHDVAVDLRRQATVGQVAEALGDHLGPAAPAGPPGAEVTLEAGGRGIDPRRRAVDAAPRSGATVRLRFGPGPHGGRPQEAPVTLRTGAGTHRLAYGRNRVADGVVVEVGSQVVVRDAGAGVVRIDGRIVRGSAGAGDGALLGTDTWAATLGVHARLRPPPAGGPSRVLPVARGEWAEHEPSPVELPAVPGRHRAPAFPWLTASVPLLLAAAVWVATGSPTMAGFMAASFVFVVASGLEGRREARVADRLAVAEFREELGLAAEALRRRREAQAHRDELRHPAVHEAIDWAGLRSHRLWERSGRHPRPCEVRLGQAPAPPDDPAVGERRGRPSLRRELDAVLAHNDPADRPCTVDLAALGGVALVGDDHLTGPLAAALVAQLAVLAPPERVGVDLRADPRRWRWAHWLPHVHAGAGLRVAVVERDHGDGGDGGGGWDPAPVPGQPVIWVAPDTAGLPEQVRAVVHFDAAGRATLQVGHEPVVEFRPEVVTDGALEATARRLAGLRSAGGDGAAAPPDALDLSDIGIGFTTGAVLAQWQRRLPGLPVPVGSTGEGVLTVDLAEDGPHALVAGTTGSGKSELLRTLLAGLAALHRPDRLNVLLVDYKGGAAFGPLAELPHCVGLVTDLGPAEVDRTLAALRAELRRREQVLEDHRAGDVGELDPAVRPPSLVLAVDEFATLVGEVPEFLDGVLDVAQRGRSLGIHMVLATQRPSGVISQAVRANTSLRIALRLPDAEDSEDVVGSPDAASLPRDVPGRALFRFGHDALVAAQVAHSGAAARTSGPVAVRPLGAPRRDDGVAGTGPSQLAALVEATAKAAADLGIAPPRPPLPPPLPRRLALAELPGPPPGDGCAAVAIGVVDLPHRQRRDPLVVDPAEHGGVLVVGGPRSGRSSALATVAAAMDRGGGIEVHGIDAGGGLGGLGALGSVRSVVDAGEHEAVHRLLAGLLDRPPGAPTLLLVDDVGRFDELQAGVNGGRASDLLVRLAGAGRRLGVVLAVSAGRRAEVSPALVHALGLRIALRSTDADQAAMMDAPAALAADDLPPGRAWVHGAWAQLARYEAPPDAPPAPRAVLLPTRVAVPEAGPGPAGAGLEGPGIWDLALGTRADDLGVAHLDLARGGALVAGRRGTGRTTVLAAIAEAARRRGVRVLDGGDAVSVLGDLVDTARRGETGARLGVVDDLDAVVDDPQVDDLLCEAVHLARTEDVRLVVSGDPQRLLRCFSEGVSGLRAGCTGVLLGADAHHFGDLLHTELPAREDVPPAPGRGWFVAAGVATLAQCGHPGPAPGPGPQT